MRNSSPVDALFPRIRQSLLAATLLRPDQWWYLSDMARHLAVPPSSLQRELVALVDAGILRRRPDGNRVYFQADPACPFLRELQGLLEKTCGLLDVLRERLTPFAQTLDLAFVYGSVARSEERSTSDVDLLIVGRVTLADLSPALHESEEKLGRPVNVTLYKPREFAQKLKAGHHFLRAVLDKEKLFVVGTVHDLERLAGRPPRRPTRHQQAGA